MTRTFSIGLIAMLGLAACGGGGAAADLCQASAQCVGGNEKDEAACNAIFDGAAAAAAEYGCSDQYEALLACKTAKSKCENDQGGDHPEYSSRDADTGDDRCETEQHNYDDCQDGASAIDD
jgi:hypothetical protein